MILQKIGTIHLIFNIRPGTAFFIFAWMCKASSVICFQLFYFYKTTNLLSYIIIYHQTHWLVAQIVLLFTALGYSSSYSPIATDDDLSWDLSHI